MAPKTFSGLVIGVVLASGGLAHAQGAPSGPTPPGGTGAGVGVAAAAPTAFPPCTKQPSKGEMDAAHYAYLAGRHSFDEGDYATAITYFKDAYRRDCTKHELLPIIARAFELSQDRASAIMALETYLKRVPAGDPNVEPIKKRLANLKAQPEKPAVVTAVATPVPVSDTTASSTSTTPPTGSPPPPSAGPTPAPTSSSSNVEPPPSTPERSKSIGPWIVMAGGAAAAVVGTVVLLGGSSKRNDATNLCPDQDANGTRKCPANVDSAQVSSDYDAGTSQMTVGGIVIGVGAAAIVSGIVWRVLDKGTPVANTAKAAPWSISPWTAPGAAGASWSGRF